MTPDSEQRETPSREQINDLEMTLKLCLEPQFFHKIPLFERVFDMARENARLKEELGQARRKQTIREANCELGSYPCNKLKEMTDYLERAVDERKQAESRVTELTKELAERKRLHELDNDAHSDYSAAMEARVTELEAKLKEEAMAQKRDVKPEMQQQIRQAEEGVLTTYWKCEACGRVEETPGMVSFEPQACRSCGGEKFDLRSGVRERPEGW